MEIFPAIDLRNGQVVRLTQGNYEQMVVYSSQPQEIARQFQAQGARNLHIVDLDGAKDGKLTNFSTIKDLAAENDFFIQVGGGIRNEARLLQYLDLGINRVILGTAAVENFTFLTEMVKKYGEKIAVGVDAKNGYVAINGWQKTTKLKALDFCQQLIDIGVKTIIYTDIAKDGTLSGTNLEIYQTLSHLNLDIVASGGISFEHEIIALKEMPLYAAIVGKAIYANTLNLKRVIDLAQ
ncbi:MAG: 1-(5-phosphoribosyl)-5-[(5-phosphoribosylamino)methylideneamino]imidazole-4-carboxamide isomerase [Bacillota bacterium]|jgi:phosphoribosylformimino-5-aminoimidazole carboxamide ribotide isomerase